MILYVPDIARILRTTEAAIRAHIQRRTNAIPPWFRRGRKICWNEETVENWCKELERETTNDRVVVPARRRLGGNSA